MKRYSVIIFLSIIFAGVLLFGHAAYSYDGLAWKIDTATIAKGYTAEYTNADFKIGIPADIVNDEVVVNIKDFGCDELPMPAGLTRVSDCFIYDILWQHPENHQVLIFNKPLSVAVRFHSDTFFRKKVFYWDSIRNQWYPLASSADYGNRYIRAFAHLPFSRLAVFEDQRELEGVASWYRSSKYKYGVATNNYPNGTKLRVRNVDTGKTVDVEVVSTGPFGVGRVVDLTLPAFQVLEEAWRGLVRVQVWPISGTGTVLGVDTSVLKKNPPTISSKAAIAINEQTGQVVYEKNSSAVLPIASLTKIMTAVVFLETNTPMDAVVTYQASDNAIGAKLYVSPGETMRVKDLYFSSLAGSANNATNALARSTGLSREEFIKRMNDKAAAWGLTQTHFADVTGLDANSTSTVADYARLAARALKDFRILQGTKTPVYSFTTINTGTLHTIKNKDKMLDSAWYTTGMKTGYLDEALYCLMTKARKDKTSSPDVITVVLGSATDAIRYKETNSLISYALDVL